MALLLAAPVAATLHWLESWLAHDMAYRLLAEMRIALFAKLDRLAPAYLLRRRSGDLVALATQDVETVEYFYAHTVAPAVVALVIPASVLALLAAIAWPLALVLLPFLAWAGLAPVFARGKIDRLAGTGARHAGPAGGPPDGDDPGPGRTHRVRRRWAAGGTCSWPTPPPTSGTARRCWTICRGRRRCSRSPPGWAAWRWR